MSKQHNSPSAQILKRREYNGPLFFKQGFRPFFLGAGLWSALAMGVWLFFLVYGDIYSLFSYLPAQDWHMHEMLYGFMPAAVAGFLLTAVPNWTGRLPVRGGPLAALAGLWLAGRLVLLFQALFPNTVFIVIAGIDSLFLVAFGALLAREIFASNNWKNVPVVAIVMALAASNIVFHLTALNVIDTITTNDVSVGAILLTVLLVTLIGGRIVPSFTRNWLALNKAALLPAAKGRVDQVGSLMILLSSLMLLLASQSALTGALCIATALAHFVRLSRWRGLSTLREPLVFVLHVAYGWIGIGFFLAGLSILFDEIPFVAAIHAFSAGMFGSMILAVMTRATRGHTGNGLEADKGTLAIYVLVNSSALIRVASALWGYTQWGYLLSGLAWIAAFSLFTVLYLPMFIKR